MKKLLAKLLVPLLVAAVCWGGYLAWQSWRAKQALTRLTEVAKSADLDQLLRNPPDGLEEAIDLAVRGVRLSQGEAGRESWTLDADWATLRQESGLVQVNDPVIRYALGDPSDADVPPEERQVVVTAETGRVEDNNTRLTMEGNVRAEYRNEVLTGPVAVFRNDTRILTFPDGARLAGPVLAGSAGVLRWSLATNILDGEQGVDVVWTPRSARPRTTPEAVPADLPTEPGGGMVPAPNRDAAPSSTPDPANARTEIPR